MSSMFGAGFGFLFALPVLIGQWIGVIHLAKCGRTPGWWCMAVGTVLATLGSILSAVFIFLLMTRLNGSGDFERIAILAAVTGGLSGLGSLVFAVGFAMHGLRSGKMRDRIGELESVLAAQGEQLSRQNAEQPS